MRRTSPRSRPDTGHSNIAHTRSIPLHCLESRGTRRATRRRTPAPGSLPRTPRSRSACPYVCSRENTTRPRCPGRASGSPAGAPRVYTDRTAHTSPRRPSRTSRGPLSTRHPRPPRGSCCRCRSQWLLAGSRSSTPPRPPPRRSIPSRRARSCAFGKLLPAEEGASILQVEDQRAAPRGPPARASTPSWAPARSQVRRGLRAANPRAQGPPRARHQEARVGSIANLARAWRPRALSATTLQGIARDLAIYREFAWVDDWRPPCSARSYGPSKRYASG